MNWHFSRALVEEFSAATCSDGAPCVPSNLNHMPQLFSSSDRMMDFCGRSLCGMTCAPLTESLGAELLTLFRAGFPVRTSAQQETRAGFRETGDGVNLNVQQQQATHTFAENDGPNPFPNFLPVPPTNIVIDRVAGLP
jgi:hypothetical protein